MRHLLCIVLLASCTSAAPSQATSPVAVTATGGDEASPRATEAEPAPERAELTDDDLEAMAEEPGRVTAGEREFASMCQACHGENAEGHVGPNLTDDYWLLGGSASDIHRVVRDGRPDRGMVGWESTLGEDAVLDLVAYVISLRGHPVAGRQPEGERWVPEVEAAP